MELIIALLDFSGVGGCQIDLISATLLFIQNGKGKGNAPVNAASGTWRCTVLYLEALVLVEALPNSVNPKLPISVKSL